MCPLLEVIHRIPTSLDDVQVVDGVNRRQITKETAIQEDFDDRCMIHQRVWACQSRCLHRTSVPPVGWGKKLTPVISPSQIYQGDQFLGPEIGG